MKKQTVRFSDSFKATQLEIVAPANLRSSDHKIPDCAAVAETLAMGGNERG